MNNHYEKMMQIVDSVGLKEAAAATVSAMDTVTSRSRIHVAFIGGQNSGKTTVINAIAGKEIREPSNISIEDELPLRVTFERTDKDARFECVDVYDKDWNGENAVIFEFKSSDIVTQGTRTPFADEVDVVFYLISAMNAFTSEDVSTIQALTNHKIILVLTKLDAIEEENRAGVLKYVTDMRTRLGLGEPLMIDRTNSANISKIIRDALPLYEEQKEYKEKYCDVLLKELTALIKEKINIKISELDGQISSADNSDSQRETYSQALHTKNKIIELGIARSKKFESDNELVNALTKKLLESGSKHSYSDAWKSTIERDIIEPMIHARFKIENERIKKHLFDDCSKVNPTDEESQKLKEKINEVSEISARVSEVKDSSTNLKNGKAAINFKTVGVTAAVVAGTLLIPMPAFATWIVSVGTIAVGTGAVITEKSKNEAIMWNKNIKDYAHVIAVQFYEGMKIYNNDVYEKLADFVFETMIKDGSDTLEQERQTIAAKRKRYVKMIDELE